MPLKFDLGLENWRRYWGGGGGGEWRGGIGGGEAVNGGAVLGGGTTVVILKHRHIVMKEGKDEAILRPCSLEYYIII